MTSPPTLKGVKHLRSLDATAVLRFSGKDSRLEFVLPSGEPDRRYDVLDEGDSFVVRDLLSQPPVREALPAIGLRPKPGFYIFQGRLHVYWKPPPSNRMLPCGGGEYQYLWTGQWIPSRPPRPVEDLKLCSAVRRRWLAE